ncbi:MAG TPA: SHOCT domain-containing protein [Candidatus Dormibacteraeota bacterium]|nr:SHOCT domain-containing protein [Candidatus Dormibacteraeota bacterium]
MWPYYGGGWSWLWMAGMMVVFWGAVIVFGAWAIRSFAGPKPGGDEAINTLRRRLAAGEITQDEFEKTKRQLQG